MSPLTSLLVRDGVLSIKQVEDALLRQVVAGGDLATVLLEEQLIEEDVLTSYLSASVGIPAARRNEVMQPDPAALSRVPSDLAVRFGIVPFAIDDTLVVATDEVLHPRDLIELEDLLKMRVSLRIASAPRIRAALSDRYGLPMSPRIARLIDRLNGRPAGTPSPVPVSVRPAARNKIDRDASVPRQYSVRPTRMSASSGSLWGPITKERCHALLSQLHERDAIMDLGLSFARQFFDATVVFSVHDDIADAREARGLSISPNDLRSCSFALHDPSTFGESKHTQKVWVGPLLHSERDAWIAHRLGRIDCDPVAIFPIRIRGRVVLLVYGDRHGQPFSREDVSDVEEICEAIGKRFESLIVLRKSDSPESLSERPMRKSERALRTSAAHRRDSFGEDLTASNPSSSPLSFEDSTKFSSNPVPANALRSERPSSPDRERRASRIQTSPQLDAALVSAGLVGAGLVDRGLDSSSQDPSFKDDGGIDIEVDAPEISRTREPSNRRFEKADTIENPISAPQILISDIPEATRFVRDANFDSVGRGQRFDDKTSAATRNPSSYQQSPGSYEVVQIEPRARSLPPPIEVAGTLDPSRRISSQPPKPPPTQPKSGHESRQSSPVLKTARASSPSRDPRSEGGRVPTEEMISPHAISMSERISRTDSPWGSAQNKTDPRFGADLSEAELAPDGTKSLNGLLHDLARTGPDGEAPIVLAMQRHGEAALTALAQMFPGPLWFNRHSQHRKVPLGRDISSCSRAFFSYGDRAAPYLAHLLRSNLPDRRYYAALLAIDLGSKELIAPLFERLFDDDEGIVAITLERLTQSPYRWAQSHQAAFDAGFHVLRNVALDDRHEVDQRLAALQMLSGFRDGASIPHLVPLLDRTPTQLSSFVHRVLVTLAVNNPGSSTAKWLNFWKSNGHKHRIEWLIDALMDSEETLRTLAGNDLAITSGQRLGYSAAAPKKDREIIQKKYRNWWENEGRSHFL